MANKKSGSKFRYSVTGFKPTMGKNAGKQMYHPTAQLSGTIDLPKLAQHMSEHDSKYNEGDIYAVLVQAVKCIKEFAVQGVKVRLGDLGEFVPKIKSTSQTSNEDVSAADISRVTLRWTPGERTKNFVAECDFEQVATRKNQALLLQAEKSGQSTMTLAEKKNSDGSDSGTGTGGNQAGGE